MSADTEGVDLDVSDDLTGAGSSVGLAAQDGDHHRVDYLELAKGMGRPLAEDYVQRSLLPLATEIQGRARKLTRPPLSVVETSTALIGSDLAQLVPGGKLSPPRGGYCIALPWTNVDPARESRAMLESDFTGMTTESSYHASFVRGEIGDDGRAALWMGVGAGRWRGLGATVHYPAPNDFWIFKENEVSSGVSLFHQPTFSPDRPLRVTADVSLSLDGGYPGYTVSAEEGVVGVHGDAVLFIQRGAEIAGSRRVFISYSRASYGPINGTGSSEFALRTHLDVAANPGFGNLLFVYLVVTLRAFHWVPAGDALAFAELSYAGDLGHFRAPGSPLQISAPRLCVQPR